MKRIIDHEKILKLLKQKGKTQKSLALKIGFSETNLSAALKGLRPIPMGYVFAIADFLKVNPKAITTNSKTIPNPQPKQKVCKKEKQTT